jgi:hypothetical protein
MFRRARTGRTLFTNIAIALDVATEAENRPAHPTAVKLQRKQSI